MNSRKITRKEANLTAFIVQKVHKSSQFSIRFYMWHCRGIKFCAKALAYGAANDKWTPRFSVMYGKRGEEKWEVVGYTGYRPAFSEYLENVWDNQQPQMYFLEAFGYVSHVKDYEQNGDSGSRIFMLTPKALELLDTPLEDPRVFISYKRDEGTALALLVLAKLQSRGVENPYIDMQLEGGDYWEQELEEKIIGANTFICVLTPKSLDPRSFVLKEIAWASRNEDMKYIFITRKEWNENRTYPNKYLDEIVKNAPHQKLEDFVGKVHWIIITDNTAKEYDSAMVRLLNTMGYAPK